MVGYVRRATLRWLPLADNHKRMTDIGRLAALRQRLLSIQTGQLLSSGHHRLTACSV